MTQPSARPVRIAVMLACGILLAGCAAGRRAAVTADNHTPPFARVPYQPISRQDVVAIALREWRLFGQPIDDDPPGTRPPPAPDQMPEREPGLWQRVGDYWWQGMNAGSPESGWTGKHSGEGHVFPADEDGDYAWSAAFISYVMRIAAAGPRFPYSASHSTYIDIAKQQATGQATGWIITAERPTTYAPRPGDLICAARGASAALTYDDLPAGHFPAHCDIVAGAAPGWIAVLGGNVDDAVTLKHVPVTADGKLATADGRVLDTRYPWMVVLRVLYPEPPPRPVA